ncbi:MAG: adenylate/guanylate cyclase domain-containing protein [Candidatus Ozemobacteraceae bacterium]
MNNRWIAIVLYAAFICLPVFLLVRDAQERVSLRRGEAILQMREQATRRLEALRRGVTFENQLKNLFIAFTIEANRLSFADEDLPTKREFLDLHKRMLSPFLPRHDLAIIHIKRIGDENVPVVRLTWNSGLGFVSSGAPMDMAFMLPGNGRLPDDRLRLLHKKMRSAAYFPFVPEEQPNWKGRVQVFLGEEGHRAFFWNTIGRPNTPWTGIVMCLLDIDHLKEYMPFNTIISTWSEPGWGVGFIPQNKRKPLLSSFFKDHRFLAKRLHAISAGHLRPSPEEIRRKTLLLVGPPLPDSHFRPIIACKLPETTPPDPARDAALFAAACLLITLSFYATIEKAFFGRGIRVPIAVTLVATFSMVALLPITGANSVIRRASVEQIRKDREDIAERLHSDLTKIDSGVRFDQAGMISRIRSLCRSSDLVENLEQERLTASGTSSATESPTLSALASAAVFPLRETVRHSGGSLERMRLHLIAAFGPQSSCSTWFRINEAESEAEKIPSLDVPKMSAVETASRARPPQTSADARSEVEMFLRFLCKPWVDRLGKGKAVSSEIDDRETTRDKLAAEVILENILSVSDTDTLMNVLFYPGRLNGFSTNIEQLVLLQVPLIVRNHARYLTTMLWSIMIADRAYLFRVLQNQPSAPPDEDKLDERIFAARAQWRSAEQSIPQGLHTNLPLMELCARADMGGIPLRGQFADPSDPSVVMGVGEAFPPRYLKRYVLAGQRSMRETYRQEEERRHFLGWGIFAAFGLAGLIALAGAGHILRPLRAIQSAVSRIASGHFDARLDAHRDDEFGSLARAFNAMALGLEEGHVLGKYVSATVKRAISDEGFSETARNGEVRSVTVLFSTLSHFATFSTGRPPAEIFLPLESHLQIMNRTLERHGGEIDKIIGEKILVVFDHETFGGEENAVSAAIAVIEDIRNEIAPFLRDPLKLAIGLNSGTVIAGILGAPTVRLDYTVIGDPVNVAARLAQLAADLPEGGVVLSEETAKASGGRAIPLGVHRVKGKSREVQAYILEKTGFL